MRVSRAPWRVSTSGPHQRRAVLRLQRRHRAANAPRRPRRIMALRLVIGRLPLRVAGQRHAAALRIRHRAQTVLQIVRHHAVRPAGKAGMFFIPRQRRRAVRPAIAPPPRLAGDGHAIAVERVQRRARHPVDRTRQNDRLDQRQARHDVQPGRHQERRRRPHGMPRDHVGNATPTRHERYTIDSVNIPVAMRVRVGRQRGAAMPAQVRRDDLVVRRQRRQQLAVGRGTEPVGVQEEQKRLARILPHPHRHLAVRQVHRSPLELTTSPEFTGHPVRPPRPAPSASKAEQRSA